MGFGTSRGAATEVGILGLVYCGLVAGKRSFINIHRFPSVNNIHI